MLIIKFAQRCVPAAATQLRNLINIVKIRKASSYEPWWRFKAELLSPAISARMWFDSRLRHNALS